MTIQQTFQIFKSSPKLNCTVVIGVTLFLITNVLLDFLFTVFQNSLFYISESLLFSSYWLLFLPILPLLLKVAKETQRLELIVLAIGLVVIFHSCAYPGLVWIISKVFYTHTFNYWQTFSFGLSTYFIKTTIIYGFSFIAFTFLNKRKENKKVEKNSEKQDFVSSIVVSDSNNQKIRIQVEGIFYFSANSPYTSIHAHSNKYLHTITLKDLEAQLDNKQFVRIHKSHIVNIHRVLSMQSRLNGDYDITLTDNRILRVSRNYAKNFKSIFEMTQLTLK